MLSYVTGIHSQKKELKISEGIVHSDGDIIGIPLQWNLKKKLLCSKYKKKGSNLVLQ
jgi:hypothetical protein